MTPADQRQIVHIELDVTREPPTEKKERKENKEKVEHQELEVYHGGQGTRKTKGGLQGNYTWNIGDIDFEPDGSIFIRNPYLADAIEAQIEANYKWREKWRERKGLGTLGTNEKEEPFLFRLTRDEGWSGEKQNVVC